MMPVMVNEIPVICINHAAITYHVPATVLLSVIKKEGGRNGDASRNKNGTVDYGVGQVNSIWLPKVAAYGYTKDDIQYNPCKNIEVTAWILAQGVAESKTAWQGVGNFHSHTPKFNQSYRHSVQVSYDAITRAIT